MASNNDCYVIKGIHDGLDPDKKELLREVHLRMEIDDWYQSEDVVHINQRALFFPAFWRFQQMDPKEKLSYFQIAGIHGKPFIAWDEPPQKAATEGRGYCTHNSILFATWHRPYLLLFEQVIFELMKDEIEEYDEKEDKAALLQAAQSWRFPYWDWAMKKPLPAPEIGSDYNVPLVLLTEKVRIRLPAPKMEGDVINAFYEFRMPGAVSMSDKSLGNEDPQKDLRITASKIKDQKNASITYTFPFDHCKATSRHPKGVGVNEDWIGGKQDNSAVAKGLRDYKWDPVGNTEPKEGEGDKHGNMTASLRGAFYRLLTISYFDDFATKRAPGAGASEQPAAKDFAFDSCENLHDNMHGWCGGESTNPDPNNVRLLGHMSHVPLAAFDPIFWLHHANCDRLIAIWQILHETRWFDGTDTRDEDCGTFSIDYGHKDHPDDDLRPFHKDSNGNYWTSEDAREVTALGYTYPNLEKWKYLKDDGTYNKELHIEELTRYLNQRYNSSSAAAVMAANTASPGEAGRSLTSMKALMSTADFKQEDITVNDYVLNVVYEKFALGGTKFTIHVFIGKIPNQLPYNFQTGTEVGQVVNFSTEPKSIGTSTAGCGNCQQQQVEETRSTGRVILTNALITRWKNQVRHEAAPYVLESMEPKHVIEFLKANLQWKVTSVGAEVDISRIPSLEVSVAAGKADHYADHTKLSKFYDYNGAPEATQGKPGGAGSATLLYPVGQEVTFGLDG